MPRLSEGADPRRPGGLLWRVSGRPEPAAEGRGSAGARRGDPGAARGGNQKAGVVMERRTFLAMVPGSLLAAPRAAQAQQTKAVKIGYLTGSSVGPLDAFKQTLGEHGYMEGRNLAIETRSAEGRVERLSPLAAELAHLNVDVF